MRSSMMRSKSIVAKRYNAPQTSILTSLSSKGFTLIETVIFIVVLGIIGVAILAAFVAALQFSPNTEYASRGTELAQQRMDVILGQKYLFGFAGTQDPCIATPGLPVCAIPAGYTVSSSIANNWLGDVNYKVVTVTVGGLSQLVLTSLVANY